MVSPRVPILLLGVMLAAGFLEAEARRQGVEGLKDFSSSGNWITYGEKLATVFHGYFGRVKP